MAGIVTGSFSGTGVSATVTMASRTAFNVSIDGGAGTIEVERSFDSGDNWFTVKTITGDYQGIGFEPENKTQYQLNCTAFTSGPINYRIGTRIK